jgi:hypothetical protein
VKLTRARNWAGSNSAPWCAHSRIGTIAKSSYVRLDFRCKTTSTNVDFDLPVTRDVRRVDDVNDVNNVCPPVLAHALGEAAAEIAIPAPPGRGSQPMRADSRARRPQRLRRLERPTALSLRSSLMPPGFLPSLRR